MESAVTVFGNMETNTNTQICCQSLQRLQEQNLYYINHK